MPTKSNSDQSTVSQAPEAYVIGPPNLARATRIAPRRMASNRSCGSSPRAMTSAWSRTGSDSSSSRSAWVAPGRIPAMNTDSSQPTTSTLRSPVRRRSSAMAAAAPTASSVVVALAFGSIGESQTSRS